MKVIIPLIVTLFVASESFATNNTPAFYSAEYRLTEVKEICPHRGGISCMAIGSRAILTATIGCTDKVLLSEVVKKEVAPNKYDLYVVSVVQEGSDNIRCIQAGFHQVEAFLPSNNAYVQVINAEISQR